MQTPASEDPIALKASELLFKNETYLSTSVAETYREVKAPY